MKTPFEYLNSYRIEVAGEQLLRSDSTVAQIAVNCGFNDVSYFSKIFRRYMGDTPLNYRKKYKTVE
jgi:AraC-like DNA-binding protein